MQAAEMVADGDVLGDGEVGEQRQILIDHLDAAGSGLHRVEMRIFSSGNDDAAAWFRPQDAGHDLDQGRFARAVFTNQAMDLALFKRHVDVTQGNHAAESFGDRVEVDEFGQMEQPLKSAERAVR